MTVLYVYARLGMCAVCADMGKWLWSNSEGIRAKVSSGTSSLTSALASSAPPHTAPAVYSGSGNAASVSCWYPTALPV